jgi:ubiquinone/menaquinone biosynthesis C-methylase UbiE
MQNNQETSVSQAPSLAATFDYAYSIPKSETMTRLWREVYGDEFPPNEVAAFSFISRSELEAMARELKMSASQTLVDLACGGGGPGLWVARDLGANLVGVDISAVGIAQARARAGEFGMNGRARFQVGDFMATGLESDAFDGAMSVDALWLTFDKASALREVARILKPGARFVFTTWESTIPIPNFPPQVQDHRPLLRAAGFEVELHQETPNWEKHQRGVYEKILAARDALLQEQGEGANFMLNEAAFVTGRVDGTDYLRHSQRMLIVARRKDG